MRNSITVAITIFCCACSASPTPDDANTDAGTDPDGTSSIDAVTDAAAQPDASYAPCPGCCDPVLQDCSNVSDSCVAVSLLTGTPTTCTPAGTHMPDESCTTHADCVPGSQCGPINDPGPGIYVCSKLCASDADCFSARPECRLYPDLAYGLCF